MTYIEYAKKLGIRLNSAQIEILNLIEKQGNENLIISFPRISGRQMLYDLIERKKGYEQGIADERKRIIAELEEKKHKVYSTYSLSENNIDLGITYGLETAIEIVRGDVNE